MPTIPLYLLIPYAVVFIGAFLFSPAYIRFLVALTVMTNGFDLLPEEISGIKIWDAGILLLIAGSITVLFKERPNFIIRPVYAKLHILFIGVMAISFFYSFAVYGYPLLYIIKSSRQMILGYLTFFAFIGLFETEKDALLKCFRYLYVIFSFLLLINVYQYLTNTIIFQGYIGQHGNSIRSIPIFLGFSSIYFWYGLSKILTHDKLSAFDVFYSILYFINILISYTRGYYLGIFATCILLISLLIKDKKLKFTRTIIAIYAILFIAICYVSVPVTAQFTERATSTVTDLLSTNKTSVHKNSIALRYYTLLERIELVAKKNPFLGYGFIHEDIAKRTVHYQLGTWNDEQRYRTFSTPDIAWVNLIIYTGFAGTFVFIALMLSILFHHIKISKKIHSCYYSHNAFFLCIFTMFFLMVIGSSFSKYVHLQMFAIAAYLYLTETSIYSGENPEILSLNNQFC